MSNTPKQSQHMLRAIMLAVLAWGIMLALGVRIFRGSWLGAGIVIGSTLLFLGGWQLLLNSRRRPPDDQQPR